VIVEKSKQEQTDHVLTVSITEELVIMQGAGGPLSLRVPLYCCVIKAVLNPICLPTFSAKPP